MYRLYVNFEVGDVFPGSLADAIGELAQRLGTSLIYYKARALEGADRGTSIAAAAAFDSMVDTLLSVYELDIVARIFGQDCIAYRIESDTLTAEGLVGPAAGKWAPFNPALFWAPWADEA